MTDFTIIENFSNNGIVFDSRFSNQKACYDYLFKQIGLNGFIRSIRNGEVVKFALKAFYFVTEFHNH